MSATIDRLRTLRRQRGSVAAPPLALPAVGAVAPADRPTGHADRGVDAAQRRLIEQAERRESPPIAPSAPPRPPPAAETVAELRRLLRVRAPAPASVRPPALARASAMPRLAHDPSQRSGEPAPASLRHPGERDDRALPGVEIAPHLRLVDTVLPACADDAPTPERLCGAFAGREPMPSRDVLCFDTETTGLAGGTGTRAFMIGAAQAHGEGLRIRQWFITALSAERDLLAAFAEAIAAETVLVSYNGRSYDAPLLAARYRLARLENPLAGRAHVDLLHPARRRYRGRWENCRLATIEHRVLGVVREDDLPGREAPAAWLRYLRGGSARDLRRVAAHNRQDLDSLWRLLLRFGHPEA